MVPVVPVVRAVLAVLGGDSGGSGGSAPVVLGISVVRAVLAIPPSAQTTGELQTLVLGCNALRVFLAPPNVFRG